MQIYQAFLDESGKVLRTRDPRAFQAFVRRYAHLYEPEVLEMSADLVLVEISMHKMICARKDLDDLHFESKAWLKARGYSTF